MEMKRILIYISKIVGSSRRIQAKFQSIVWISTCLDLVCVKSNYVHIRCF